jgi:hypothetical protein
MMNGDDSDDDDLVIQKESELVKSMLSAIGNDGGDANVIIETINDHTLCPCSVEIQSSLQMPPLPPEPQPQPSENTSFDANASDISLADMLSLRLTEPVVPTYLEKPLPTTLEKKWAWIYLCLFTRKKTLKSQGSY